MTFLTRTIRTTFLTAAVASASAAFCSQLSAGVFITEFNSNATTGGGTDPKMEFVEFTNTGVTPVDMTGWAEDDSDRGTTSAGHNLSAFGTMQPGESAIFTEASPDAFRTFWWGSVAAAPVGLKIIGPYTTDNLSSSGDEINLYNGPDPFANLVDRLLYNASNQAPFGGGTASGVTRNPGYRSIIGTNQNIDWVNSALGDAYGSFAAAANPALIGNPGTYIAPPAAPPGDFNQDGHINAADIGPLMEALKDPNAFRLAHSLSPNDLQVMDNVDGNGVFNNADLQFLLTKLITGGGSASVVPEPATCILGLLGAGLLGATALRRR